MTIFKRLFSTQKAEIPFNMYHPDLANQVEFAFECLGKKYYRMAHEFRLPTGRYKFLDAYLQEHEMRMTLPMLEAYLDKIEAILNGKAGIIKISDIAVTVHNMRTHTKLAFLPESVYRLASVSYFDETEDLRDYDKAYGEKKIKDWLADGKLSFFLTRPIVELLNLEGISVEHLQTSINEHQSVIDSIFGQLTPSLETSSKEETLK
jgi:hypothetical protein